MSFLVYIAEQMWSQKQNTLARDGRQKRGQFEGHFLAPLFGPTFGTQRKSPDCA